MFFDTRCLAGILWLSHESISHYLLLAVCIFYSYVCMHVYIPCLYHPSLLSQKVGTQVRVAVRANAYAKLVGPLFEFAGVLLLGCLLHGLVELKHAVAPFASLALSATGGSITDTACACDPEKLRVHPRYRPWSMGVRICVITPPLVIINFSVCVATFCDFQCNS